MPWRSEIWVSSDIEPEVLGDTVRVVIPSGTRTITLRTSRNAARDFAVRLLNALNQADREQSAKVFPFKTCGDDG